MSDFLGSLLNEKAPSVDTGTDFLGSLIPPEKAEKRNPFAVANDTVITGANAVLGGVQAVSDFVSPGNQFSQGVEALIREGEEKQSTAVKQGRAKLSAALESEDIGTQLRGVKNYVLENPLQAAAMAAGSFVPVGGAIGVARLGATALGAGAKVAGRTALGAGSLAGGAMAGGDAAGSAYQEVMNAPALANMPIDERERIATDAARKASAVPFVLGAASGLFGAEKALATGTKSILKTAGSEFITEAIEEGGTQLSSNIAAAQAGADVGTWKGVAGSAALGGVLGGGTGLAVGALQKQPDSLLEGSTNISTGNIAPDANAIDKAIDSNSSELGNTSAQAIFAEQRATELRAQAEQEQAKLQEVQAAQQQEAAKQAQEQAQAAFNQGAVMYGVKPVEGTNRYQIGGKTLFTQNDAVNFLKGIDQLNEGKPEEQKAILGAAISSGAVKVSPDATPKTVNNAATKFLQSYGFDSALDKVDAAERADVVIQSLEGPKALKQADVLNNFYKSITGTNSPAFDALMSAVNQQEGVSDERLQLQNNAGLRAVSEQGGTTQASGTELGNVRPTGVQPIQPGSIGEGSLGLQTGAVPTEGISERAGTSTSGLNLPGTSSGQEAQVNEQPTENVAAVGGGNAPIAAGAGGAGPLNLNGRNPEELQRLIKKSANLWYELDKSGLDPQQLAPTLQAMWVEAVANNRADADYAAYLVAENTPENVTYRTALADIMGQLLKQDRADKKVRLTDEKLAKKILVMQEYFGDSLKNRGQKINEVAEYFDITPDQVRAWTKEAQEFPTARIEEIKALVPEVAKRYGQTEEEFWAGFAKAIEENKRRLEDVSAAAQAKEETTKTELEVSKKDEEGNVTNAASITGRVTGISVNDRAERGEKASTNFIKLANQRLKAQKAGDTAKVEEIDVQIEELKKLAAKSIKTAAARAKSAGKEEKILTTAEKAEQIWNTRVEKLPSLNIPAYSELPKAAQEDWKDSVEGGNTKAADMNAIYERYKNQFQKTEKVEAQPLTKEQQKVIDSLDYNVQIESDGKMYDAAYMSLEDMLKFDGIASAFRDLATSKIAKALKTVDAFVVFKDLDADGIMTLDFSNDNKERNTFVGISQKLLESGDVRRLSHVVNHEIGHSVDDPGTLGVYSSQPEFNVRVKKDGTIDQSFSGSVMRELYNLFQTDENFKFLGYPFNDKQAMKSSHVVRGEVFAQMFSAMANAPTREVIKQRAPVAYEFFKDVFNDIETTAFQTSTEKFRTAEEKNIETEDRSVRFADNRGQERAGTKGVRGKQEVTFYSKPTPDVIKNNIKKLPPVLRGPVATITDAMFNAKETALGVMITADVENAARKYMKSVDAYVAARQERERIESSYTERLDKILIDAQEKLSESERNTLNRLVEDSTISGKWAYDPEIEGVTMQLDPNLEGRFKAMSPAAQKVTKDIFGYFRDVLKDKQTAIKNQVDRVFEERIEAADGPEEKAKLEKDKKRMLDKFSSIMTQSALSPYAPIKRHGPFVVVAKSKKYMDAVENNDKKLIEELQSDANEYVVEFAESMSEAQKMYDELKKLKYDFVEEPFKKNDYKESMFGGVDLYKGFSKLKQLIANEKNAADLEQSKVLFSQMETLVNDMYLTSLAETSARKSEMQRKKIAGFNRAVSGEAGRDMLRAAFSQGAADAKFIANIKTSDASIDALAAMQEEAKKKNRAQANPYLNELMAREAQSLEFRPRSILDLANRVTGDWFLTFSPGFYFQQSMQSYVLSLPWLAARFGYGKSASKLTDSYKAVMPLVKGTGLRQHLDFSQAPADVRDMLQKLAAIGAINIGIETELYKYRSIEDNKALATYNNVTTKLRGIINRIEALNRSAAAVTAYRLEFTKTGDKEKAYEAAYRIVKDTHGLYDGSNTPRLFNKNAVTRSVTQFKRFQVIQLTTLYGLARNAFKAADPLEKSIARNQLLFMLGHSFALGGVKGLPIAGLLGIAYTLGKMAFGDDDDPEDFEAFLRSQGGVLLAKGIPAYMGVDTSKLSMGNVTSLLPYTNVDLTSRTGVEKVVSGLAGPFVGGLLPKMDDGLGLMSKGEYYKGLEQVMPTGIAGAMKGYRYGTEGVTTRSGDLLISPDDISLSDSLLQAMGMPSAIITERQYLQGEVSKYDKFYNDRTRELKSQYTRAYKEGDSELLAEIRDDWKKLQESRKENGYTVQPLSVLLKAPQEQKKREKAVIGGVAGTKANKGFIQQRTGE